MVGCKGSSAIDLTGMSMLRSAEGNGRQAREPNMASKACLASSARPQHSQQHRMRVQLTQQQQQQQQQQHQRQQHQRQWMWMVCTQMHHCLQALACMP